MTSTLILLFFPKTNFYIRKYQFDTGTQILQISAINKNDNDNITFIDDVSPTVVSRIKLKPRGIIPNIAPQTKAKSNRSGSQQLELSSIATPVSRSQIPTHVSLTQENIKAHNARHENSRFYMPLPSVGNAYDDYFLICLFNNLEFLFSHTHLFYPNDNKTQK